MQTMMERIDARVAEARKQLDKANAKRDDAIKAITKAADNIRMWQRTLARLERKKQEMRAAERKSKTARRTSAAEEPMPQFGA